MNQSRLASAVEAVANTIIGLAIASTMQMLICWFYDIPMTWTHNLIITGWMTVVSVLRGYVLRRAWNAEWWKRFKRKGQDEKIKRITLDHQALAGMRPLSLEEQRELLLRLRQRPEVKHVAQSVGDERRTPDGPLAVGTLPETSRST